MPTSIGIIEKAREFQKNIYFCFIDYAKGIDYVDHNKLWKILNDMGILDHLTCLLRNVCAGQEQQLESDIEQWTGSKSVKKYVKDVYYHPAYLIYMQSIPDAMLEESQVESRLLGEISITSYMQMIPP